MASSDLIKTGEFVFKHGAKGVLLVWVVMLQLQISDIREDYKDCMNDRVNDSHRSLRNNLPPVAVLPKPVNGKPKRDD